MSGCIVKVWFKRDSDVISSRAQFAMIETEFPDFASFCEFVDADRLISGAILWTRRRADGCTEINRRQPCAFRGSAVMRCELPTWRFVEADE